MSKELEAENEALKVGLMVLLAPVIIPAVFVFMMSLQVYETWVAMTLWNWHAPWPLPFGLVQGFALNIAVSLILRQMPRQSEERKGAKLWKEVAMFYLVGPTMVLGIGWLLLWFV